jgi:hypothetical protein
MSYLNAVRLHFAGQFQTNVSTVNNDPEHFRNSTFVSSFQQLQGPNFNPPNGWFNPQGDGGFRLLGCKVTSACTESGPTGADDPVFSGDLADSDGRVCAKMADLDSEQQLVSEIWGLKIRITDKHGANLLTGEFLEAPFFDIWDRALVSAGGDQVAGAAYQSILQDLVWGDISGSHFLTRLKAVAESDSGGAATLSMKFNVDGINLDFRSPDFMCGRIAGSIGPNAAGEPRHMVRGRHFMAYPKAKVPRANFFYPAGSLNFCAAVLDEGSSHLYLDLGNALPTTTPGGSMVDLGDLDVFVQQPGNAPIPLGSIASQGPSGYAQARWYGVCAGVVALPLSADQVQIASGLPLTLAVTGLASNVFISEASGGGYLRADRYVYRLTPGESAEVVFYATQLGQPLPDFEIQFERDMSGLQPGAPTEPTSPAYLNVATPAEAIAFAPSATTDKDGRAVLTLHTSDPGTPRWAGPGDYGLDGQVYGVRASFQFDTNPGANNPVAPDDAVNPWDFVSILVWSEFKTCDPVQWSEIKPVLQQYANLYPVMNRFLDLGNLASVKQNLRLLKLSFGLDPADPNSMPVTRDLSRQKREAILAWLANPVGKEPPPAPRAALAAVRPSTQERFAADAKGGKSAAAARRVFRRGAKA